jgi:uncharacterized protein (TIGR01244 family)
MNRLPLLLMPVVAAFAMVAAAEEVNPDATPTIQVDVAEVVARREVRPVDGLTSAGQPDEEALRVFADSGYVAVIDLRGPDEERGLDEPAAVTKLGLEYIAFPIASRDEISFDRARQLDQLLQRFEGPVLLHCASGNRVGALLALRESLHGADDEAAIEYGRNAGLTGLEDVVRERLVEK